MPGESSSETENPYGRMHVTEPVRATIPVQNGARLSWDRSIIVWVRDGHPAAAGPSSACDFGVSDEQKAVFLVSVLDFSECDSSGLDHLNSMWSNARVREYFRRKIGHG